MEDDVRSTTDGASEDARQEPSNGNVVKTALLTVGGLAVGATMTQRAGAQINTAPAFGEGGHIRIIVQEGAIKYAALQQAILGVIAQIQPYGCRTCGLVGWDLSILRGDPEIQLANTPGVVGMVETVR